MTLIKRNPSKPATQKTSRYAYIAPACRRCGGNCSCSEEELDAGGPA